MNILTYKGFQIGQREIDGYVNATQMCQANGKRVNKWLDNQETTDYINHLSAISGIPPFDLVVVKQGRPELGGGTWMHPKLAICLGRWCSISFAFWCDDNIKILLETGTVSISQPRQYVLEDLNIHQLRLIARSYSQPQYRDRILAVIPEIFWDMPRDVCLQLAAASRIQALQLEVDLDTDDYMRSQSKGFAKKASLDRLERDFRLVAAEKRGLTAAIEIANEDIAIEQVEVYRIQIQQKQSIQQPLVVERFAIAAN